MIPVAGAIRLASVVPDALGAACTRGGRHHIFPALQIAR